MSRPRRTYTCGRCGDSVDGGWNNDAYGCGTEMHQAGVAADFITEKWPRRYQRLVAMLERMSQ